MKTYLGDGVYVEALPDGVFKLTTETGVVVTNTIFFDETIFKVLKAFVEVVKK